MATGETGFDDVIFDLVSVQYHALKVGHDDGQYVRDVMEQDSQRAQKCHEFIAQLASTNCPGRHDAR